MPQVMRKRYNDNTIYHYGPCENPFRMTSQTSVRRRFIDSDHGQLHLRECGDDDHNLPILCLHMVPKSSRSFAALLPELAKQRYCVAIDYPGYGESAPVPRMPAINDYAKAALESMDVLGLSQVDVVGHHTGAMVAACLASQAPDRVRKIISLSAPIFNADEVAEFHAHYAPVPLDEEGTRFRQMWERILFHRGPGMTLEMAANSLAENLRAGERYEHGHQAAFEYAPEYKKLLAVLEHEIWVMNFNDDLFEHSQRASELLKRGRVSNFMNYAHGSLDVYPQDIANLMLAFFDTGAIPDE